MSNPTCSTIVPSSAGPSYSYLPMEIPWLAPTASRWASTSGRSRSQAGPRSAWVRPWATARAIWVGWVELVRRAQAGLVVVAQHARRHLPEPGELSDIQHDDAIDKASHRVKVKRFVSLVGGEVAFAGFEDGVCVLADKVALSAA